MTKEQIGAIQKAIIDKATQKQTSKTKTELNGMLQILEALGVNVEIHSIYGEPYGVTVDGHTLLKM